MAIKPATNDSERVTRQPRTMDALEATYGTDDTVIEVEERPEVEEAGEADAAADALAQKLKDKDDEIARARAETVEARRAAHDAGTTVFNAAQHAVAERASSIESAIEARNQTIESAESALKAAMDGNDPIAMSKAQRAIARAEAELVQLERDKSQVASDQLKLKNAPPPRQQQEQRGPSQESLGWIDTHPRFDSDPEYQASVTTAHNAWVSRGKQAGTKEYVDFIERTMTNKYGANHGDVIKPKTNGTTRERPASSTAARADSSSDGGDGGGNGTLTLKHAEGSVSLRRTADGKETVGGKIPRVWVDAAKWNGYKAGDPIPYSGGKKFKTDAEGAHAYAIEQLHILEEQRQGGNAGLQFGEGGVMQ